MFMLPILLLSISSASAFTQPSHHAAPRLVLFSQTDNGAEVHLHGIGVGIDLGTTNSAVAMMIPCKEEGGKTKPEMIEIQTDERTMPSVVSFIPKSNNNISEMTKAICSTSSTTFSETMIDIQWPASCEILTGNQAIEFEQYYPDATYRNVKRVIGTGGKMASLAMRVVPNLFIASSSAETETERKDKIGKKSKWKQRKVNELPKLHKQLEDASIDPALLTFHDTLNNNNIMLRPEQISACILRKLFDVAECYHHLNNGGKVRVTRAVIGVPAYFTEAQRKATIRASELAGVPKVKLLPEPEAAALAYGVSSSNDSTSMEELILVFDLGGGTFDVSVLEVGGGLTEVLATVGNNRLGGTDFDKRVAEYLSRQAVEYTRKMKKNKQDFDDDSLQSASSKRSKILVTKDLYANGSGSIPDIILRVAEEARKSLSNQKVVEVLVPLSEEGWVRVGGNEFFGNDGTSVIGPFDSKTLQDEHDMLEGEDFIVVPLDRKIFEQICVNELQLLLQPIREVAIMAGVLLPGEARPSFVENALAMARAAEEAGEEFWNLDEDEDVLVKTSKGRAPIEAEAEEVLSEQAREHINMMDLKAKKKEQQRGRRKARDIDKRERSFRKAKQSATEEVTTASLLGKQKKQTNGSFQPTPVSNGNEKVQDGIHGRPLSRIVLVGGATRMPVIGKLLEAVVGIVPQRTVNPDEAVALGAAIQCGILDGENEGLLGGMQAVLSPMQAAIMRALAKKRGMKMIDEADEDEFDLGYGNKERMMMEGGGGLGGISGLIVDEFDDEDDFY